MGMRLFCVADFRRAKVLWRWMIGSMKSERKTESVDGLNRGPMRRH